MTSVYSQAVAASADTAIASSDLNALATTAYALGAAIDNRPTAGSVVSYDLGDLLIGLASAITPSGAAPLIVVWILPAVDGTNFPSPPGASAGAAPLGLSQVFPMVTGVSTQFIACPGLILPPYLFKLQIQQQLGVSFPASGNTAVLQRRGVAAW